MDPQTRKEGITQRMFHHHNKETLNCLRLLCVCLSITHPLKSSLLDDQLNAEFFIQRSTRSLFDSLTYKLSFYLGGKQLNCLLYLNIEVQIKSREFCPLLHSTEEWWRLLEIDTHHGTPRLFGFFSTSLEYRICWSTRKANRWESHREGICRLSFPCKPLARRKFHPRHSSYNFNFEPDLH